MLTCRGTVSFRKDSGTWSYRADHTAPYTGKPRSTGVHQLANCPSGQCPSLELGVYSWVSVWRREDGGAPRPGLPNLWHAAFTAVPISVFHLPDQRLYIVKSMYIHLTAYRLYELPLLPNNARNSSSRSYCLILFLIAILEEAFIRNVISICINYTL